MWKFWGAAVGIGAIFLSGSAEAQTQLPTIVVTAPSPIIRRPAAQPVPPSAATLENQAAFWPGTLPIVTDQFATVTVVPKDEIERSTGKTLGEVLQSKPGITSSSFAPGAASRPIVRGLDNYRVRIQENGLSSSGVSELGEDHGVPIDPLAAQQIEVIRGPATLRWGSQAIGGVVNVDNNRIPTAIPYRGISGEMKGSYSSVDKGRDGAVLLDAGAGNFALHADAYGRAATDYKIPNDPYLPSALGGEEAPLVTGRQPNSAQRANGQAIGGSYIFDRGYIGVAVSHFESLYHVPGIEAAATATNLDIAQTKVTSKGEFRPDASAIDAIRFWLGSTNYKHDEIADEGFYGIQQTFTNKEKEGRVEVQLQPFDLRFAALTTALGVQGSVQDLNAPGAEGGLFDPNRTRSLAGYMFNEFKFTPAFRMQLSGRIEQVNVKGTAPDVFVDPFVGIARDRDFTPKSGAIGFLQDLPGDLVASVTAQYVERAPRAPELFSRGVHEATETFDIGNPNLNIEKAKSFEIGLRRKTGPLRFEATGFYTRFDDFIFRNLTGSCDDTIDTCTSLGGAGTELNEAIYSQRDAKFRGAEFQAQLDVGPVWKGLWGIDGQYDIVRATFTDGSNVPRIPPQRVGAGLFYRDMNWFARVGLLHAFAQNDVSGVETTTDGYNLLKAELSYTAKLRADATGITEYKIGIVGDNLLNEDIRNAVSFKKDEVLQPGRTVRVFGSVRF